MYLYNAIFWYVVKTAVYFCCAVGKAVHLRYYDVHKGHTEGAGRRFGTAPAQSRYFLHRFAPSQQLARADTCTLRGRCCFGVFGLAGKQEIFY